MKGGEDMVEEVFYIRAETVEIALGTALDKLGRRCIPLPPIPKPLSLSQALGTYTPRSIRCRPRC